MQPLVSILIPAYNAEKWIDYTLQSAVAQTWPRKEIILVDDGSRDHTVEAARRFASKIVAVVAKQHEGASATRNHALRLAQGDYIQWLDADDLLVPDKIEKQFAVLREGDSKRILLSGPWGFFSYRTRNAHFATTSLSRDLLPLEWLLRKMGEGLHMQTATWLTSRELTETAGPWDARLLSDDDGEYFCRVLLASEGTRFVPEAKVLYRVTPSSRLSYIGASDAKKDSMHTSMKLHVQYLRSLEESDRVRKACITYIQTWLGVFYPERPDILKELHALAADLGGRLEEPRLGWKYAWMKPLFGYKGGKEAQALLARLRACLLRLWDKTMYDWENFTAP